MSSGMLVELMRRRARAMFEGALWRLERREYDLACFEAEQAAQLYLKSLLYRVAGVQPRIHDLSELLGTLYRVLEGFDEAREAVAEFAQRFRRSLWLLSESYYKARYGYVEYGEAEARECVEAAREVEKLVEKVERSLGLTC